MPKTSEMVPGVQLSSTIPGSYNLPVSSSLIPSLYWYLGWLLLRCLGSHGGDESYFDLLRRPKQPKEITARAFKLRSWDSRGS